MNIHIYRRPLSGDFRANLTPIQVAACDSGLGQQWDVITSGKHDNVAGAMLVVSSLVSGVSPKINMNLV
jgi:hypothetical protein